MRRKVGQWGDRGQAAALEAFVGVGKPKRKPRKSNGPSRARIQAHLSEVEECVTSGHWDDFSPTLLVALYMWCFQKTYGVAADELTSPGEFSKARMQAARMVKANFGGDYRPAVEFLKWVWRREQKFEEFRRSNRTHGKVLSWHTQFCTPRLITEYRIDIQRKSGNG